MSTNKTANYQLNQWVKSDQVLMDDFNADNAKIDAVLYRADRRGLQVIKEIVTTENTTLLEVTFPEIDWKEWRAVHFLIQPGGVISTNIHCYPYPNISAGEVSMRGSRLSVFPMGQEQMSLSGIHWSLEPQFFFVPPYPFSAFHSFELHSPDNKGILSAGTKITLYGEHM